MSFSPALLCPSSILVFSFAEVSLTILMVGRACQSPFISSWGWRPLVSLQLRPRKCLRLPLSRELILYPEGSIRSSYFSNRRCLLGSGASSLLPYQNPSLSIEGYVVAWEESVMTMHDDYSCYNNCVRLWIIRDFCLHMIRILFPCVRYNRPVRHVRKVVCRRLVGRSRWTGGGPHFIWLQQRNYWLPPCVRPSRLSYGCEHGFYCVRWGLIWWPGRRL